VTVKLRHQCEKAQAALNKSSSGASITVGNQIRKIPAKSDGLGAKRLDAVCKTEVVASWGNGEVTTESFEAFVKRYMKDAYFIALGLVGNQHDALDLSQEAFFQAYRHRKRLKEKSKLFPWFYRILRNLCFMHLRKQRVRQAAPLDDTAGQTPADDTTHIFDPEAIAQRNEDNDKLWRAIGRLEEKHREVIILRHFRNLSYEQMAAALFCNKGTIMSRLYYARKKLKDILDNEKGGKHK
jgi:RNA polymerase sigma-70 factor (ECF subfamily)